MPKMIRINGCKFRVLNAYSCGPGCWPHTYDIRGAYVYEIAGVWKLVDNAGPREVTVEVVS